MLLHGTRVDIEERNGRSESNCFECFEPPKFQDRNGRGGVVDSGGSDGNSSTNVAVFIPSSTTVAIYVSSSVSLIELHAYN